MKSDKIFCLVNCSDIGQGGVGAHTHNDLLSFVLSFDFDDIVVDTGTFTYTADEKQRNHFRSTAMHNTCLVNHKEISHIPKDIFHLAHRNPATILNWETNKTLDTLTAEHDNFSTPTHKIVHQRTFVLQKKIDQLEITDKIITSSKTHIEWNFHFNHNIKIFRSETHPNIFTVKGPNIALQMKVSDDIHWEIEHTTISPSYGELETSVKLHGYIDIKQEKKWKILFIPVRK